MEEKNVIPDRGFKDCCFNEQLSDFAEGKEIKDTFKEELKDIEQFWRSKKSTSKDSREVFCFCLVVFFSLALGKIEKWQIDSEHISIPQNVRKPTYKHYFSKLFPHALKD